jgi:hypothetical protein
MTARARNLESFHVRLQADGSTQGEDRAPADPVPRSTQPLRSVPPCTTN